MTKTETPRDGDGAKLCAWCGGKIRQSGVGRSKDYCSRTHKEYAYRARRDERLRAEAYEQALADARRNSTTAVSRGPVSAVAETVSGQVPAPAPDGDFLLSPPAGPEPRPAPRRLLSRARSGIGAGEVPLWRSEGVDGEPDA